MSDAHKEFRLKSPLSGRAIRDCLRVYMKDSWYQEREKKVQVRGKAVSIFFASSIQEFALFSSEAGWTDVMCDDEIYESIRFHSIHVEFFIKTPDQW